MFMHLARLATEKALHHRPATVLHVVHERWVMTEQELIEAVNAAFPGANACSLSVWARDRYGLGAVVCGEARMANGEVIGPYIPDCDPPYDGYLHTGFIAWAEEHGWHVEVYEPGTLFLMPLASIKEE